MALIATTYPVGCFVLGMHASNIGKEGQEQIWHNDSQYEKAADYYQA